MRADENMYVHSDQRRNSQPRPFHQSSDFILLPPRPRSSGDVGPSSRFDLLGLQVRGFSCPLQQRPGKGRGTPQSLTLLSREKPVSMSRTGNRPEVTPGASSVCSQRVIAETPTDPHVQQQAPHTKPGTTKMSELHLYLPSSLCDDEEQDAGSEDVRSTAEDTKPPHPPDPGLISQEETTTAPTLHPTASENTTEDDPEHRGAVRGQGLQSSQEITPRS